MPRKSKATSTSSLRLSRVAVTTTTPFLGGSSAGARHMIHGRGRLFAAHHTGHRVGPGEQEFRLVAEPTKDDYHFIDMRVLRDLGRHIARVYRVNEEYAQLYENRTQDSRDLNEPPSNILGGLGVFSAFNSDSIGFAVVRDSN